jgi:hypothetical protein
MPRPKQYGSDAERARAWRERRSEELREQLVERLREADDATLERLVSMVPMPALLRLSRALEWAADPDRAEREHGEGGGHRHGRRHQHHHHRGRGPWGRHGGNDRAGYHSHA